LHITNRDLALVAAAAFITTACAVLMTVRDLPDHATLPPSDPHAVLILPKVARHGGSKIDPQGPLRVRLDAGKAKTALLSCDLFKAERPITRRQASFASIPVGDCTLALDDTRPYVPVYPGDSLHCHVDDGHTTCAGGLAKSRAATVDITSDAAATLSVDGKERGALPVKGLALRVGRRALRLDYPDGRNGRYGLVVEPDQRISVHFPAPPGARPAPAPKTAPATPIAIAEPAGWPPAPPKESPRPLGGSGEGGGPDAGSHLGPSIASP